MESISSAIACCREGSSNAWWGKINPAHEQRNAWVSRQGPERARGFLERHCNGACGHHWIGGGYIYIYMCVYIFINNGGFFHPVRLWRSNDGKTWYLVKWEGFLAQQLWVRSWCLCLAWFYFSTLKQLSTRWEDTLWLRYRLTPGMAWSLDGIYWGLFWMSSVKTILGVLVICIYILHNPIHWTNFKCFPCANEGSFNQPH